MPKESPPLAFAPALPAAGAVSFGFALLGALTAFGTMELVGTPERDRVAFEGGVALAGVAGAIAAYAVQRLRFVAVWANVRWLLVPLAGALVGMGVQALLLRTPVLYVAGVGGGGLTRAEPASWVLAGAPLGAVPAIGLMLLLQISVRIAGSIPPLDARERMLFPLAASCLVGAAAAVHGASRAELPVVVAILALAAAALLQILVRDVVRASWLARAFEGDGAFAVVPFAELPWTGELPAFLGGVPPAAAVVRRTEAAYRSAACAPLFTTADDAGHAREPVLRRRVIAAIVFGVATAIGIGPAVVA